MGATKSMKPSEKQARRALSLAGLGVDRVNPRAGRGKFIVVGVRALSLYLCTSNVKNSNHISWPLIKFKKHRKISIQHALRDIRRVLLKTPRRPIVLRQCCPAGDLLELVASMEVPMLSGKFNLPPGSGPLKDGTPELILEHRKAQYVSTCAGNKEQDCVYNPRLVNLFPSPVCLL